MRQKIVAVLEGASKAERPTEKLRGYPPVRPNSGPHDRLPRNLVARAETG